MEHKGDGDTDCSWSPWNAPCRPGKIDWLNYRTEEESRSSKIEKKQHKNYQDEDKNGVLLKLARRLRRVPET